MDIQTLKSSVEFLQRREVTTELFFLFKQNDEISIKRAKLQKETQLPIVQEIVRPYINRELDSAEELIPYDPAITPDKKCLFHISSSEIEQYELAMSDIEEVTDFHDSNEYSSVWAYMIKVSLGDDEIIAIRKKFPSHILKQGVTVWHDKGLFKTFNDKVFTLDKAVDAFLLNKQFIIFQRTNFEQIFLYNVQLEGQARRNIKEIASKYGLLEITEEDLGLYLDKQTISKLRQIDMSLLEDGILSFDSISEHCLGLGIQLGTNTKKTKFQLKDKKEFKIFIKLISDDYLRSALTNRDYNSHSKEVLKIKTS